MIGAHVNYSEPSRVSELFQEMVGCDIEHIPICSEGCAQFSGMENLDMVMIFCAEQLDQLVQKVWRD